MPDLGLDTPELIAVRLQLFERGILGNVDRGGWRQLAVDKMDVPFGHIFFWLDDTAIFVGRIWPSCDGKGRSLVPMTACAHCQGMSPERALRTVLPRLQQLEVEFSAAHSPAAVTTAFGAARDDLLAALVTAPLPARPEPDLLVRQLDRAKLTTILYHVDHYMGAYTADRPPFQRERPRGRATSRENQPADQVRVPAAAPGDPDTNLFLWVEFFESILAPRTPLILIANLATDWVDVITGRPTGPEFFYIRAGPLAMPVVTDIPYQIDAPFTAQVDTFIAAARAST